MKMNGLHDEKERELKIVKVFSLHTEYIKNPLGLDGTDGTDFLINLGFTS